jgi:hypothetical protein
MLAARTQALRLGPLRDRIGTWTPRPVLTTSALPGLAITALPAAVATVATTASISTVAAAASISALAVATSAATLAASSPPLRSELGRDEGFVGAGTDDHQTLRLLTNGALGRQDGEDLDPLDLEVRISADHVADGRSLGYQRSGHVTLRLLGAGCPPRPCSIRACAGELDVEAARHR